jgi:hypothetical protein|tara:strand:+ start:6398 stop:7045 length:648 start_codon:yes stop_codon:yes gene_type:complete
MIIPKEYIPNSNFIHDGVIIVEVSNFASTFITGRLLQILLGQAWYQTLSHNPFANEEFGLVDDHSQLKDYNEIFDLDKFFIVCPLRNPIERIISSNLKRDSWDNRRFTEEEIMNITMFEIEEHGPDSYLDYISIDWDPYDFDYYIRFDNIYDDFLKFVNTILLDESWPRDKVLPSPSHKPRNIKKLMSKELVNKYEKTFPNEIGWYNNVMKKLNK